jgi:phosphatidate cytidylyltransferase
MPCVLLHRKKYDSTSGIYLFGIVLFLGIVLNQVIVLYLQGILLLLYPLLVGCVTDIFALLGGRLIGKHKFTKISPNKTIEGCLVGAVFAVIIGTTFYVTLINADNVFGIVILSLVLSIVNQIGDLFFSLIKRENEVKDFSNLIPGHGGIIDRIDGLTFVILAFVFIMKHYI